jgi:hypothetical protein
MPVWMCTNNKWKKQSEWRIPKEKPNTNGHHIVPSVWKAIINYIGKILRQVYHTSPNPCKIVCNDYQVRISTKKSLRGYVNNVYF